MTQAEPKKALSQAERFIQDLEKLADDKNGKKPDRAALAALRRGLGKKPGEVSQMHLYIVRYIKHLNDFDYRRAENSYYLVASLFALWHSGHNEKLTYKGNLGASFAKLKPNSDKSEAPKEKNESIEKRFVALLNSHQEDLADHLRHAVSLLKSKEIGIDWLQLLKDLQNWDNDNRYVQRDWARAFWSKPSDEPENSTENNPSETKLETKSNN